MGSSDCKTCAVKELDFEPSAEDFFRDYVQANEPVIIRKHSAVKTWGGLNWNMEYLHRWADESVQVAPLQVTMAR